MVGLQCPVCESKGPFGAASLVLCRGCGVRFLVDGASDVTLLGRDGRPSSTNLPLTPEFQARWRCERVLGAGGYGTVYLARDSRGHQVAIKFLTTRHVQGAVERFQREINLLTRLRHPHVVSILDSGEVAGYPYLVCEYMSGGTLAQRLRSSGAIEPAEALRILAQVLEALTACHELGIIHRDLKPDNVLFTADGVVKLADLGIAKDYGAQAPCLTQPNMVIGTPQYMSPEQIRGDRVGAATDIYAAGVLAYEMMTGAPPFQCRSLVEMFHCHENQEPPPLGIHAPWIPPKIARSIHAALSKRAADRFPTAKDFAQALRTAAIEPAGHRPKPVVVRPVKPATDVLLSGTRLVESPFPARVQKPVKPIRIEPKRTASYYHESGRVSLGGFFLMLAGAVCSGMAAGALYGPGSKLMPLVELLMANGFIIGALTGLGTVCAAEWCRVRNRRAVLLAGVLAGFIAEYFSFVSLLVVRCSTPSRFASAFEVFDTLGAMLPYGFWESPSGGGRLATGHFLMILWLAELAAVVFTAGYVAWRVAADLTYCEACDRWLQQPTSRLVVHSASLTSMKSALVRGDVRGLASLRPASVLEQNNLKLELAECKGCNESRFLSLKSVSPRWSNGTLYWDETRIVDRMHVSAETHRSLVAAA